MVLKQNVSVYWSFEICFVIFNESTNMYNKYSKKSFLLMSLKKCYAIIVLVGLKWIFCFYDLFFISIVFFQLPSKNFCLCLHHCRLENDTRSTLWAFLSLHLFRLHVNQTTFKGFCWAVIKFCIK